MIWLAPQGISATAAASEFVLENRALRMEVTSAGEFEVLDVATRRKLQLGKQLFEVRLSSGRLLRSNELPKKSPFTFEKLPLVVGKGGGFRIARTAEDTFSGLKFVWSVTGYEFLPYLKPSLAIVATRSPVSIDSVSLVKAKVQGARAVATGKGQPLVANLWFMGMQDVAARNTVIGEIADCAVSLQATLAKSATFSCSAAIGVVPEGQRRRTFNQYLASEGFSFEPLLHYRSGEDLARPMQEADAVNRIRTIGQEMVEKRKVQINAFVFEPGWESPTDPFRFAPTMAQGLTPLRQAALRFKAGVGVGFGPTAKDSTRLFSFIQNQQPTVIESPSLNAPIFTCRPWTNTTSPYSLLSSNSFFAPVRSLRGFEVEGSPRQAQITKRDFLAWQVSNTLFPIQGLANRGVRVTETLDAKDENAFRQDIHMLFASGVRYQGLSITPSLLTPTNWDDLSKAARWSRANSELLADAHFVGGNPIAGEVYGYAAWTPKKAILVLRNPGSAPQAFIIQLNLLLESPVGFSASYSAVSPWPEESALPVERFDIKTPRVVILKPFEVRTWELTTK